MPMAVSTIGLLALKRGDFFFLFRKYPERNIRKLEMWMKRKANNGK